MIVVTSGENYLKREQVETVTLDTWVQIVAVYKPLAGDATDISLYIDGVVCTYTDDSLGIFTNDRFPSSKLHWIQCYGHLC